MSTGRAVPRPTWFWCGRPGAEKISAESFFSKKKAVDFFQKKACLFSKNQIYSDATRIEIISQFALPTMRHPLSAWCVSFLVICASSWGQSTRRDANALASLEASVRRQLGTPVVHPSALGPAGLAGSFQPFYECAHSRLRMLRNIRWYRFTTR